MNDEALERVTRGLPPGALDAVAALPGSDLTTVMLEIARRRAERSSAAEVLRRYGEDRFVRPGEVDPASIRLVERRLFGALPAGFEEVALAPLTPIGTHALAGVAQSRLISTDRATEVAADPTTALTLEAAMRRRALMQTDPRSRDAVRLAASQRVVRAQRFEGEAWSHFGIFGMITAGRDTGSFAFERDALAAHLRFLVDAIATLTGLGVRVTLTDLSSDRMEAVLGAVAGTFSSEDRVEVALDPDRSKGRNYYEGVCFKVHVVRGDGPFEIADGGFVDWTQQLLASRKERLLISGLGVERLTLSRGGT
ncbi:MAG: hypothetical protein ACXVQJ_08520 [Actinomycetota bacterium]